MLTWLRTNYLYILIVALVAILYGRTLGYGFIWDDYAYIINNSALGRGTDFFNLWTKTNSVDFWPVAYSFFWMLKYWFLADPFYYHLANLFLFSLSCIFLLKLLQLLNIKNYFFLTILFVVHPMNVSTVSWIFQAKTNLANVFGLLSCIFFIKFCKHEKFRYYVLTFSFLLLSLLSKISLVMLPVMFFMYLYLTELKFKQPNFRKNILLLMPFLLTSLILGIINILWDRNTLPVPDSELILNQDLLVRFLLSGQNYLFYIYQTFFPQKLMFVHPRIDPDPAAMLSYLPSVVLFFVLIYSLSKIIRKNSNSAAYFAGLLASFMFLLPVLGFAEIYFMRFSYVAEHYLTLGMLGFIYPVMNFLDRRITGKVLLYLFAVVLTVQSYVYISDYESEKKLLEINITKNPNSILPHNILGLLYKHEGEFPKAMAHFDRSIEIHPNAASYYNKASLYEKLNQFDQARFNYEKSIELNPYVANSYNNLAIVYLKLKNLQVALDYFNKGLRIDPNDVRFYYNIGYAHEENKNSASALEWYKKALQIQPTNSLFKEAVERVRSKPLN